MNPTYQAASIPPPADVETADAITCDAPAIWRVGRRYACATHIWEVTAADPGCGYPNAAETSNVCGGDSR